MKTMELHYAKTDRYGGEELEYRTWYWESDKHSKDYGWNKCRVPFFSSGEVAGKPTDDRDEEMTKAWFKTSNREDIIFLMKEKMACEYWYDKEMKEIHLAQKNEK